LWFKEIFWKLLCFRFTVSWNILLKFITSDWKTCTFNSAGHSTENSVMHSMPSNSHFSTKTIKSNKDTTIITVTYNISVILMKRNFFVGNVWSDPDKVFEGLSIDPQIKKTLLDDIQRRLTPKGNFFENPLFVNTIYLNTEKEK
jgi:hypothetical protein